MARAPQKGVDRPGTIRYGPDARNTTLNIAPPGRVYFASDELTAFFETTGARVDPPKPRVTTLDRMDTVGLTQWVGQDPYTMTVGIRIDGFPDHSVERQIAELERFGEVQPGRAEPPIVAVSGAVPQPHPNIRWRFSDFGDPAIEHLPSGERCRYLTTVSLVQYVTDSVLVERLKATSKSKGLKARKTEVRSGEDYLYDVARRVYKDPSRAADLATANNLHLGKKLTHGLELRVP